MNIEPASGNTLRYDGKSGNFAGGLTVGLGNNWALQVKYGAPEAKAKDMLLNLKHEVTEYNVLYRIDKSFALFAGYASARIVFNDMPSDRKNGAQFGLQAVAPLGGKTSAFAVAGWGKDLAQWEVGLSQQLADNVDFNVSYKESRIDKARPFLMPVADWVAKGLGFGFTFRF